MIDVLKRLEEEAKAFEADHDEQSVFAIAIAVVGFQLGSHHE